MKTWTITYYNDGEAMASFRAKTKQNAIKRFRDNIGFYTILKVEEQK